MSESFSNEKRKKSPTCPMSFSTKNVLLEKLVAKSSHGYASLTKSGLVDDRHVSISSKEMMSQRTASFPTRSATLESRASPQVASDKFKRSRISNPMLNDSVKSNLSYLTKNTLLESTCLRATLRTTNTLLAPSFHDAKSPKNSALDVLSSTCPQIQDIALPEMPEVSMLSKKDVRNISKCVGNVELDFPSANSIKQTTPITRTRLDEIKADLVAISCTSLVNSPIWFSDEDQTRSSIYTLCDEIAKSDPEFVLKVAIYTRGELNIRTTCNFILAVASFLPSCRPYLKKYFETAVCLPSDWIQITEFYQSLSDPKGDKRTHNLPAALRKVLVSKFPDFDDYQLAKYNKDKSKSAKKKEKKKGKNQALKDGDKQKKEDENKPDLEQKKPKLYVPSFTLKYLIRKLHIVQPAYPVMCILGKKYPSSQEEFYKCGLEGSWDSAMSGQRMKLAVPETWETQVSAKGNVAKTWESLLDHRKLPFMAMLRNLRNMIRVGVSEKHHQQILKTLTNEKAVSRSRQFPFRFFSAYEILDELAKEIEKQNQYKKYGFRYFLKWHHKRHLDRKFGDPEPKSDEAKKLDFVRRQVAKKYGQPFHYDEELLERYRNALNESVKIATVHNVSPIPGHTIVLCEASIGMFEMKCTSSKGIGSSRTLVEIGILLGLMCAYSCEACTFIIYSGYVYKCVELEKGGILKNLSRILHMARIVLGVGTKSLPEKLLRKLIMNRIKVDNLLLLSAGLDDRDEVVMSHFLQDYKSEVNSSLLCYKVNLGGKKTSVSNQPGVVSFSGYSEQILKFIALGSAEAQMKHVESIDAKLLNLIEREDKFFDILPPVVSKPISPWRTVRVFISSTIKDMMNERDVLVTKVFPLLREKAKHLRMHVLETDLRWGITGDDTRYGRNISICLQAVQKCDIFIGLLGDRYGWVPKSYGFSDESTKWLEEYPKGRSITELEIAQAAFQRHADNKMCLFYFRNSHEIKTHIPKSAKDSFFEKSLKKIGKLKELKNRIIKSGHYVGETYTPEWDEMKNDAVKLTSLDAFETMISNDLFLRLEEISKRDPKNDDDVDCDIHKDFALRQDFVARSSFISALMRKIGFMQNGEGSVVAVIGSAGYGKTAILAKLYRLLSANTNNITCIHFARADLKNSQSSKTVLRRICSTLTQACRLSDFNVDSKTQLLGLLKKLLNTAHKMFGSQMNMFVLLDEIDGLDGLDWFSKLINEDIKVIVSCTDGDNAHKALKHINKVSFVPIPELTISDKREIVRCALGKHSKKLDESHFNNQLQVLMSKKHSTNPMYLLNICDAIRVDETFETLGETLKAIPHDMIGSLKWRLDGVEKKFVKYPGLIAMIFGVLYGSREWKIAEDDLCDIINCSFASRGQRLIPKAVVINVINSVKSFLVFSEDQSGKTMTLHESAVYQQVLENRYFKQHDFMKLCQMCLAAHYTKKMKAVCIANTVTIEADDYLLSDCLKRLPTHLVQSGNYQTLQDLLSDVEYILLKCKLGSGKTLLQDFNLMKQNASVKLLKRGKHQERVKPWEEMEKFVKSKINTMSKYPNMVHQEALNQGHDSYVRKAVLMHNNENRESKMVQMEGLCDDTNSAIQTFRSSSQEDAYSCLAVGGNGELFSAGTLSGKVKIIQKNTGKEITYVAHSHSITALCFVKPKVLVSGANDGSMIVWHVKAGHQITLMKPHEKKVADIVVRPASQGSSGQVVVSGSSDRSIAIWSLNKWCLIKRIPAGSPVNCLDFHPSKPHVAAGLWDASIRIWDVQTFKRLAVIRGHQKAVSSLQFSSCGNYIVSCSKYETVVRMWVASTGTPLGNFSEPYLLSPEAVTFSSDGKYLVGGGAGANEDSSQIAVWKSKLGKEETCYQVDDVKEYGNALCCKYNSSKSFIAVGFHEGYLSLYDSRLPNHVYSEKIHDSAISCVVWSHNEKDPVANVLSTLFLSGSDRPMEVIITGSHDHTLKAVDLESKNVIAVFEGHSAPVLSCDCSSKWLASGSEDFSVMLWRLNDINKPNLEQNIISNFLELDQNQSNVNVAQNSSELEIIVTTVTHAKVARRHEAPVSCVTFSSAGDLLLSGGRDGKLCYWSVEDYSQQQMASNVRNPSFIKHDLTPIVTIHQAHKDWITCCAWNDLSDTVVTGSNDATLKVWKSPTSIHDAQKTGYETPLHVLTGHTSGVTSVVYQMGCVVSTGGEDHTIKVWSHKGIEITSLDTNVRTNCCDVRFYKASEIDDDSSESSEFDDVNSNFGDGLDWADQVDAEEWNIEHAKRKPGANKSQKSSVSQMRNFDLLCASNDASIVLWKPLVGQKIKVLNEQAKSVSCLQVCNDTQIISRSSSGIIKAWDIGTLSTSVRQNGEATGVAPIHGGLVSTCSSGYIYLWEFTEHNRPNLQYKAKIHEKRITSLAKLQENTFATSAHDKKLMIWSVETLFDEKSTKIQRKILIMDTVDCIHPLQSIALAESDSGTYKFIVGDVLPTCCDITIKQGEKSVRHGTFAMTDKVEETIPEFEKVVGAFYGRKSCRCVLTHTGTVVGGENIQIDPGDVINCFTHSGESDIDKALLVGSNNGNLYRGIGQSKVRIHDSKITAILDTGRYFVTTSHDSTIKIWEKRSWQQVGQFFNSSPVTAACVVDEKLLAYGDSTGVINAVTLHF